MIIIAGVALKNMWVPLTATERTDGKTQARTAQAANGKYQLLQRSNASHSDIVNER
jgi:hypothetical protein